MNNEVIDARALTRFLENRLKDLRDAHTFDGQTSAACGSAIGTLEGVLSFVKNNTFPANIESAVKDCPNGEIQL